MRSLAAYRHVGFAAGVHGFSHRVDQVAADAEVAHLHLSLRVDQHVGGLHVCDGRDGRQLQFLVFQRMNVSRGRSRTLRRRCGRWLTR